MCDYITVFDYSTGDMFQGSLTEEEEELLERDAEEFFRKHKLNYDEVSYMTTSLKPEIYPL